MDNFDLLSLRAINCDLLRQVGFLQTTIDLGYIYMTDTNLPRSWRVMGPLGSDTGLNG